MSNVTGYIMEHRFVVSEALGRNLEASEIVHHKNEVKSDNRLENLEITSRSGHASIHMDAEGRKKMGDKIREVRGKKFWSSYKG